MSDIIPAPPAVVRNEAQAIQELFRKNVVPTYARFEVVLKRGEGSQVWDVNGKRYLDLGGGIAVCALGHANPEVTHISDLVAAPKHLDHPFEDYIAYLADGRELTDPAAGQPVMGPIGFDLPAGTYRACLYSPAAGEYSPGVRVTGGGGVKLEIPSFEQDIVLRVTRES